MMVGRSEQLAALREIFDRVCEGSPAVVLLGGEAGAGKARLITEFTGAIGGRAVLRSGDCVDLGGAGWRSRRSRRCCAGWSGSSALTGWQPWCRAGWLPS